MARKDLLKGLMGDAGAEQPAPAQFDPARPRRAGGAIGAVSKSIAELKSRSVTEIDPRMVDGAGLADRLDRSDAELEGLVTSIREYGQQVPVLLRVNPNDPERYQVVYGRRRVAALRQLGQPVKALIRDLDDRALIMAQGQENTARKDLTFIEKANFARQMRDSGYAPKVISDALSMDKTLVSRMLKVADTIPLPLIEAIGSAPSYGRDRWLALAAALEDAPEGRDVAAAAQGDSSDARFEAVMAALSRPQPKPRAKPAPSPAPQPLTRPDGEEFGRIARKGRRMTVTLDAKASEGFDDWLAENIERIHRDWKTGRGE